MKKQRKLKLLITKVSNLNNSVYNIYGGNTDANCETTDCDATNHDTCGCGGAGKTKSTSVKVQCFTTTPNIC
ncbi:hypothetical protein U8527_01830 [Kordia algicida OT-1]|uniref:Uncharacterized protein n=1 Tax=Kordia algicida OT-1 TaxID=391587 RepID=A9DT94_9FLAO|nr:hypothetical protein [Kordia algicida]EDP97042.1 hypothetical protein KAOT1_17803 [Kordia algicida OT-1]